MDFYTMIKKASEHYYSSTNSGNTTYELLLQDFTLICKNAFVYNLPKSLVYSEAQKLKKLGEYTFEWFKPLITQNPIEFLTGTPRRISGQIKSEFMKQIEELYLDILFTEPETNPKTTLRLLEIRRMPNVPLSKRPEYKEIIVELSELNFVLSDLNRKSEDQDNSSREIQENSQNPLAADTAALVPTTHQPKTYNTEIFNFMEELLNTSIMNNYSFFNTPPAFIQFSNPALLIEEICYLCGSFGDSELFLRCRTCSETFHHYCISKAYAMQKKFEYLKSQDREWQCPRCKTCERCSRKSEDAGSLICLKCDKLFHSECLYPGLKITFPPSWQCEDCFACSHCNGNKVIPEGFILPTQSYNSLYAEFCEDFKYCYECGLILAIYKFCRKCAKYCQKCVNDAGKNRDSKGEEIRGLQYISAIEDSVKCEKCKHYYHISCYQEDFGKIKSFENFTCYYCKQDFENIEDLLRSTFKKGEELRRTIQVGKTLFKLCEMVLAGNRNDDNQRNLQGFVTENLYILIENPFVKEMLENFKYLDPATKMLTEKSTSAMTKLEPWEVLSKSWSLQTLELISSLEVELARNLEAENCLRETDFWKKNAYDLEYGFGKNKGLYKPVQTSNYIGGYQLNLGDRTRLVSSERVSSISLPFLSKPGDGGVSTYELINSPLRSLQEAMNCFKQEGEVFEFCLNAGREEKNFSLFREYAIVHPSSMADTRSDCVMKRLRHRKEHPSMLFSIRTTPQFCKDLLINNEPESIAGLCEMKEDFPFKLASAYQNRNPSVDDFKSLPEYNDLKEIARMMMNEMKAIEFIRLRYQQWKAQLPRGRSTVGTQASTNAYHLLPSFFSGQAGGSGNALPRRHDGIEIEQPLLDPNSEMADDSNQLIEESKGENTNSNGLHSSHSQAHNAEDVSHTNQAPEDSDDSSSNRITVNKDQIMDIVIDNIKNERKHGPLHSMECICCRLQDDRALSGRLLFVEFDKWVHTNCALWSYDVYEDLEGGLFNFLIAYSRGMAYVCQRCGKSGATLICNTKKCSYKYHFHCALEAGCSFLTNKKFYCKGCSVSKNRLVNDFSTKRRLFIKRNQQIVYPDSHPNPKDLKERQLNLDVGGYARVGALSLLSLKRLNLDTKLLFSEYYIVRLINKNPLLLQLDISQNGYILRLGTVDKKELTHINFLQRQLSGEYGEKIRSLSVETVADLQNAVRKVLDQMNHETDFKRFMGEFLGITNDEIRKSLKASSVKQSSHASRTEVPSFDKSFYSEDIDELNPFDKADKVHKLFEAYEKKIARLNVAKAAEPARMKNPRDRSFNTQVGGIKQTKRKADNFAVSLELVVQERIPEPEEDLMMGINNKKIDQIQAAELDERLKLEYPIYRNRSSKVFVAPSPIHKYGLFALEK